MEEEDRNPYCEVPHHSHRTLRCHVENIFTSCKAHGVTLPANVRHTMLELTSSVPPTRVGFYGNPHVGKSTIIDRLLETNLLRNPALTGTKTVIEMLAHSDPQRKDFLFDFAFVSDETVRDWHAQAISDARFWRAHRRAECPSFLRWFVLHFTWDDIPHKPTTFAFEEMLPRHLPKYKSFLDTFRGRSHLQRAVEDCSSITFDDIRPFALFVQHVSVFGPFHLLRALHISIIDIPSVHEKEPWLWEERSHLTARLCKDIFFVTDGHHLSTNSERQLLELSQHCASLSVCCTHAAALLGSKKQSVPPRELCHRLTLGLRGAQQWNWRMLDLLQHIHTHFYAVENREGIETEFDPFYDLYWTHFVDSLKIRYGRRFENDVYERIADVNHLFALSRQISSDLTLQEVTRFAESFSPEECGKYTLNFAPKLKDWDQCLPQNYKALQCWLTHEEGYWHGEWRNSKMQDLMETLVVACYPSYEEATLFNRRMHNDVDNFIQRIKNQLYEMTFLQKREELISFIVTRSKFRLLHQFLDSFVGFRAFFQRKAAVILRDRYGSLLHQHIRRDGINCRAEMSRALKNWFALESQHICEELLPQTLQQIIEESFAQEAIRIRHDAAICAQVMRVSTPLREKMAPEQIEDTFARIVFTELQPENLHEARNVEISAFLTVLKESPELATLLEGVSPFVLCAMKHDRGPEAIHLSALEHRDLLFAQKSQHDVRARCGRVELFCDHGSIRSTLSTWLTKDAALVEAIVHHCLKKTNLSQTLDYFHCPFELMRNFTARVVEYVDCIV